MLCIVWDGPQALSLHSQDPGQNHREGMGLPGKWRCQRGHGLGAEIGVSTQGMRNFGPILPERGWEPLLPEKKERSSISQRETFCSF